jgi:protein-S-isoprenylcysteine O-methyltransferase Ste14
MDTEKKRIFSWREHEDREDLAAEHSLTDIGQIIGALFFLSLWIIDTFILRFSTFLSDYVPLFIRVIFSLPFFALSFYMSRSGLKIVFQEVRKQPHVIAKGVFGWVRHPIYLSELIFYLGFFILSFSLISLAVLGIIFVFLNYVAAYEEKKLEEKYGQEYLAYQKSVGKWLPAFKRPRN